MYETAQKGFHHKAQEHHMLQTIHSEALGVGEESPVVLLN